MPTSQIFEQLRLAFFTTRELDHLFAIPEFDVACAAFDGSEGQVAYLVRLGVKLLRDTEFGPQ